MRHDVHVDVVLPVLYVVLLGSAGVAGARLRRRAAPAAPSGPLLVTPAVFVVVAVISLLQLTAVPSLLVSLQRDRTAISGGQWWRLVTSAVVQDSGWPGTIFNLVALAILGMLVERLWGPARWAALALVVQVVGGLWGLVVQPVGAGTSLIVFGFGGALGAAALVHGGDLGGRLRAGIVLLVGVVLLSVGDIHGGATLAGAFVATPLIIMDRRRSGRDTPTSGVRTLPNQ
jgi:rhomboid protease GluP